MKSPFPQTNDLLQGVQLRGELTAQTAEVLSPQTLGFLAVLHRSFNKTRLELLMNRKKHQLERDSGKLPDFLPETRYIRDDLSWKGAALAPGLEDRRVEITGPTDRKMVINALNSKVATFMADFEDSLSPTWENVTTGQVNLYDAVRENIELRTKSKLYKLSKKEKYPTLIVRPRGWHLVENHLLIDGEPISASLFDFGIYFFNNAKEAIKRGTGPYFYLPKMEHHLEAKLWNDVFNLSQDYIKLPRGTIRATVLIETLPAVFQLHEIIYQLREHSSGLNCGRWDYIFSYCKSLRNGREFLLPDRGQVTMKTNFMSSYTKLLVKTCNLRGVHAMGGMSAKIPSKDFEENRKILQSVYDDKYIEAKNGFSGSWIAHPGLADTVLKVFNEFMPGPNQIGINHTNDDVEITNYNLLSPYVPGGKITKNGIRTNVHVGLCYIEAWLRGIGCSAIDGLMEDAATAEVSRTQLNQWVKHGARTCDNVKITKEVVSKILEEELNKLLKKAPANNMFKVAARIYEPEITDEKYSEFITLELYEIMTKDSLKNNISTPKL